MKKILGIIMILFLTGCAAMTYEAPNGTKVTYTRIMTGADVIKGETPEAKIEAQGQRSIDPATLQALITALGAAK